jgi:dihydroorotate dehydrogenase
MPDWSYHTILRPLLFRLPAEQARDVTLGAMGRLAAAPGGRQIIEWLGHMRPPPGIARTLGGLYVPGPVGLGPDLDPHAVAPAALAQFGFGFLEVGPITLEPVEASRPVERRTNQHAI